MHARAESGGGEAGQRAVAAFAHYVAGDMAACAQSLQRDRGGAFESIGGSNEERALLAKLHDRARSAVAGRPGTPAR
jgi:hypothetical protein